jgi:hypothetical protein
LASVQQIDIDAIGSARDKRSKRPAAEVAKARIRLVTESTFATLKCRMGLIVPRVNVANG